MSQKHMVTEEFIEGMMGEISTAIIPYQQLFSSSYREFMRYYPSFLPKFESHNSYPVVVDAFIDYDELISNYCFAQGFLGAAGGLLGQVVKPAGLKQIPGLADLEQALEQTCRSYINEFPPEEHAEFNSQFARKKRAIEDSWEYYYLAGYEIMFTLLKRAGYELSDKPLKKLYKAMWAHNNILR